MERDQCAFSLVKYQKAETGSFTSCVMRILVNVSPITKCLMGNEKLFQPTSIFFITIML